MRAQRAAAGVFAVLVAGCAVAPRVGAPLTGAIAADAPFELSGRLSARRGETAVAASFRWTHRPGDDDLVLATPFGEGIARLSGGGPGVALELPDGRSLRAGDWESLTGEALGVPVPVRGLASWVRGLPHPGAPYAVERDATGRVRLLRQDGWEIVYGYRDDGAWPSRLVLVFPEIEIRLAVDAFAEGPAR